MGIELSDLLPDSIREQVLAMITPSQEEINLQTKIINQLVEALMNKVESTDYQYSFIEPEGSTGRKQTQLRGAADIDLFVALKPEDYPQIFKKPETETHQAINNLMHNLVSDWFEPAVRNLEVTDVQRAFSQHPFLSLKIDSIDIDILGCFDIDTETLAEKGPITAVDRTVHHTGYVVDRMTQKKREDVRILKSFVRACHAYGDTCAVGRMGLTGVTLEIIVIEEPNLDAAIQALRNLDTEPIDPLSRNLTELKKIPAFRDDYVFLIDPTDHSRNMASSFSPRSYAWVQYKIDRLRESIESESSNMTMDSLIESPISSKSIPDWLSSSVIVHEFRSDGDIHYTILRDKLHRLMRKILSDMKSERTGEPRFGEILGEVYFEGTQYAMGMLVETPTISKTFDRKGPPAILTEAADRFRSTHKKTFESNGFLYVREEREWTKALKMFENILKKNPIDGLKIQKGTTKLSNQLLNVLYEYVLLLEPEFRERITRVKEKGKKSPM
jgi:tRNA nucleotidyltransferase (CCA-adding enzyme)